jgi:CIC family chloride channel protein
LPGYVATPGAYALVGMGTAFAGVVRAPMTSVVMIFEITRDYAVIVPLMISNLVSFFISARFQKQSIYEVLAHQDGIHLPTAESRFQEGQRQVAQAMRDATEVLPAEMTVQDGLQKAQASAFHAWPVSNARGVVGVVSLKTLRQAFKDNEASKPLSAIGLIAAEDFPHVHEDHSLNIVLDRMGANQLDLLPVVSRADVHKLLGIVTLQDVLEVYGVAPEKEAKPEEIGDANRPG